MSDELKKQLTNIQHALVLEVFDAARKEHEFSYGNLGKYIEQIEQAFSNAGYWKLGGIRSNAGLVMMAIFEDGKRKKHVTLRTGQYWYDRFEHEMNRSTDVPESKAWEAAKKASGLS